MTDEKQHTNGPQEDIPSEPKQQPTATERRTRAQRKEAATAATPVAKEETKAVQTNIDVDEAQSADEQVVTRKERAEKKSTRKPDQQVEEEREEGTKRVRWVQLRILPIYVRVLIVLVMLVVAILAGAMIGYSVLGNGSAMDIFQKETWTHIWDIMSGKE